jgi:signal peptidase I
MSDVMRYVWCGVVASLVAIYAAINYVLPRLPLDGAIKSYVLQPVMWVSLAVIVLRLPRWEPAASRRVRSSIVYAALLIGIMQVAITVIGGLFSGFGRSPYSFALAAVAMNVVFAGTMLVGVESSRAWLVNHFARRHAVLAIVGASALFLAFTVPVWKLLSLRADLESVRYLGDTVLPVVATSLLASYLAYLAGWRAAMAYRGTLEAFWWLCPVLPNLSWAFESLIGTAVPVIGMVLVNSVFAEGVAGAARRRRRAEGSLGSWIATGVVGVVAIWFAVGLFPLQPVLVASGSMRPALDVGDVAIIVKVPASQVGPGDVIQYRSIDQPPVIHRVIDVQSIQGSTYFVTQGDANDAPDLEPVIAENVVGKHVYTVRDVGWISVAIKEMFVNR